MKRSPPELTEIPPALICPTCGKPMKVIDIDEMARALGLRVPDGEMKFVIKCCGNSLRIEDDNEAEEARKLLTAYHAGHSDESV